MGLFPLGPVDQATGDVQVWKRFAEVAQHVWGWKASIRVDLLPDDLLNPEEEPALDEFCNLPLVGGEVLQLGLNNFIVAGSIHVVARRRWIVGWAVRRLPIRGAHFL